MTRAVAEASNYGAGGIPVMPLSYGLECWENEVDKQIYTDSGETQMTRKKDKRPHIKVRGSGKKDVTANMERRPKR
jgi:hypothetical protein